MNSNDNWLNQIEAEFVQQSVLQKRRNISWRWRITLGALLLLSSATIIAINNAIDARNKLLESNISLVNNLFISGRQLDALVKATETGKMLRGHNDDARRNFKLAREMFELCSVDKPEAKKYLQLAEQEIKNLGG